MLQKRIPLSCKISYSFAICFSYCFDLISFGTKGCNCFLESDTAIKSGKEFVPNLSTSVKFLNFINLATSVLFVFIFQTHTLFGHRKINADISSKVTIKAAPWRNNQAGKHESKIYCLKIS